MTMRFSAFRQIRNRTRKSIIKLVRVDGENYDRSLFPVNIDPTIQDELIGAVAVPSILRNKFEQQGITRLGQLQGLDTSTFLSWRGFGPTCFTILCGFLSSLRSGELNKLPLQEFEQVIDASEPSPDILSFPIDKLNFSTLLKTQLKNQFELHTVQDFLEGYQNGKLSRPGIGTTTIQQIFKEITTLSQVGANSYQENISLDSIPFIQIISLARAKLTPREQLIFDHRFAPFNARFLTLESIAQQLALTRERVRQIEVVLVKKLQSGTLREFGWAIRRNALSLFQNPTDEFTFEQFIVFDFFRGSTSENSKMPPPVLFLDRVFYSTFSVTKNTIQLTDNARRNFT
jgi:hypothetical protein